MTGAQLKSTLQDGGRVYGTMATLTNNPRWARVFTASTFDYVIVDTEHSPFSRGEVADQLAILEEAGIAPFVRIPIPDAHYVTMAMDAGAHGILAPYCETVEQVREVVGGTKWRPLKGALLDHALLTGEFPSTETKQYLAERNKNSVVLIGIESVPAIDNLEAMLDVPGVDVIFVGPHDLSLSVGVPEQYTHPQFESALQRIMDICNRRNVPVATHFQSHDLQTRWMQAGVRFVLHLSDRRAMAEGYRAEFDVLRRCGAELEGKTAATTQVMEETV